MFAPLGVLCMYRLPVSFSNVRVMVSIRLRSLVCVPMVLVVVCVSYPSFLASIVCVPSGSSFVRGLVPRYCPLMYMAALPGVVSILICLLMMSLVVNCQITPCVFLHASLAITCHVYWVFGFRLVRV